MIGRMIRDVLVYSVWAGGLTAFALGSDLVGLLLSAVGVLALIQVHRGRTATLFGASSKPTTTPDGG